MPGIYRHIARRGVEAMTSAVSAHWSQHIEDLQAQAKVYESNPQGEVQPWEMLILIAVALMLCTLFGAVSTTTVSCMQA